MGWAEGTYLTRGVILFLGPTGAGKVCTVCCNFASLSHQDLLDRILQGIGWILIQRRAPGTVRHQHLHHLDIYLNVDYRININMSEVSTSAWQVKIALRMFTVL